jgi:hypothetical protein
MRRGAPRLISWLALGSLLSAASASADLSTPGGSRAKAGASGSPRPNPAETAGPGPDVSESPLPFLDAPYHGRSDGVAYGGNVELRFAEDRVLGVTNPEWFSFGSVNGFLSARIHPRVRFLWEAAYDRALDDFSIESAYLDLQVGTTTHAHAGIFLVPLGRTNQHHEAPLREFDDLSLVATQIIGVPNAELGVGIQGAAGAGTRWPFHYEIDLVTGYDDGVVMDSPGGTRVPSGRNNYGDNNGVPAISARIALTPSVATELGFSAQSGKYNETSIGGVTVDQSRYVHVIVADAATVLGGCRVSGEAAAAMIDVPPGLGGLYADRQWGAAVEADRVLFAPVLKPWRTSSLTVALRADGVDFDRAIQGDSRSRLAASVNVRPRAASVLRLGWYYEVARDRFNNSKPMAGLVVGVATYF